MENEGRTDSFIVYRSFVESIKKFYALGVIGCEGVASLFFGMSALALDGEEADLSPIEDAIFTQIRPLLNANRARYENACKGGRPPSGVTAEEIRAKQEELGSLSAAAEYFGISERTAQRRLTACQNLTKLTKPTTKLTKPNDHDNDNKNDNDNIVSVRLAVSAAVQESKEQAKAAAPIRKAGSLAEGFLDFRSEEEQEQGLAILAKAKRPPAGNAGAGKEQGQGNKAEAAGEQKQERKTAATSKQLGFDFLIAETDRKILDAKDSLTKAWHYGERDAYKYAQMLIEGEGASQKTMQKIKERAEQAFRQCGMQDLKQEARTRAMAYYRASKRVLEQFFKEGA